MNVLARMYNLLCVLGMLGIRARTRLQDHKIISPSVSFGLRVALNIHAVFLAYLETN